MDGRKRVKHGAQVIRKLDVENGAVVGKVHRSADVRKKQLQFVLHGEGK